MEIKTLCLGILSMGASTGYEIKKTFETRYSHFFAASYGSIYPALTHLTDEGLVSCSEHVQEKRPAKKIYTITSAGRLAFFDALMDPPARDRVRSEFFALMIFADLMPPKKITTRLDERINLYRTHIEIMESHDRSIMSPGEEFVQGFGLAFYKMAAAYIEQNRHTLEGKVLLDHSSKRAMEEGVIP